ncbi:hypothetical protein NPIL_546331 [Nephila pilipes]|uniref:Uncharacterized protein n=1 Tax=Nephila pilipes TaxID=299642 RepID=A0A8X6Q3H4_NEPPI|nr:hypothetical protein NPIL_546331 [Nephila pilipes]
MFAKVHPSIFPYPPKVYGIALIHHLLLWFEKEVLSKILSQFWKQVPFKMVEELDTNLIHNEITKSILLSHLEGKHFMTNTVF